MKYFKSRRSGFTIVEVVVVITVIAILATLSTMAYRSYLNQTDVSRIQSDLQRMNLAVEKYYAKNGSYPLSINGASSWGRRAANGPNFIAGLVPDYIATTPDVESGDKSDTGSNTYLYISNGRDYKLIRLAAAGQSIPEHEIELVPSDMRDPNRWDAPSSPLYRGWGFWSAGASTW